MQFPITIHVGGKDVLWNYTLCSEVEDYIDSQINERLALIIQACCQPPLSQPLPTVYLEEMSVVKRACDILAASASLKLYVLLSALEVLYKETTPSLENTVTSTRHLTMLRLSFECSGNVSDI